MTDNINSNQVQLNGLQTNPVTTTEADLNEKMIRAYIGPKADIMYEKVAIKKYKINIFAIILGPVYFIYRKMYLVVLIIFLLAVLFSKLPIVFLSFYVVYFMFYFIYRGEINRKIKNIKNKNKTLNNDQLIEVIKKKGGTNLAGAIITSIFIFVVLILISFFNFSNLTKKANDIQNKNNLESIQNNYDNPID